MREDPSVELGPKLGSRLQAKDMDGGFEPQWKMVQHGTTEEPGASSASVASQLTSPVEFCLWRVVWTWVWNFFHSNYVDICE